MWRFSVVSINSSSVNDNVWQVWVKFVSFHAVKCNLTKLTAKSGAFSITGSSPDGQRISRVDEHTSSSMSNARRFVACSVGLHKQLPVCFWRSLLRHFHPLRPPFFFCSLSVTGACGSSMGTHGWVAGIASHGSGTLPRSWLATSGGPVDIPGTQPPLLQRCRC